MIRSSPTSPLFPYTTLFRSWNPDAISAGKDQKVQIDLGRVALIVRGLLKIHAVGQDLALALRNENPPSQRLPLPGAGEVGEQHPRVVEREGLTRQMRIG